jgi:hypothetical protein
MTLLIEAPNRHTRSHLFILTLVCKDLNGGSEDTLLYPAQKMRALSPHSH